MDIKFIRLKNGDDIIARCRGGGKDAEEDSPHFIVANPLKVIYFTNPKTGNIGLSFMHWIFPKIAEANYFKIYCEDILTVADASNYIIKSYTKLIDALAEAEENLESRTEDSEPIEVEEPSDDDFYDDFYSDLTAGKRTRH